MSENTVSTRYGRVRGLELDDVVLFAGLSYASAPSGALRFSPPAPPERWSGVRDATTFGPVAPQPKAMPGYLPGDSGEQHEECRTLNVWAPTRVQGPLPVLVFVHGGAFISGSGSSVLYRGDRLARRGAIVVTFNYRLGALGFLAHETLAVRGEGCGNWGLADQLAALSYVQDNIAAFGGDPKRVTVFGESAGAMSVADLLGMPRARGLFARAVLESGAVLARPLPLASRLTERFARLLGVGEPKRVAFEHVALEELLEAQSVLVAEVDEGLGMPFGPTVDGGLIREHPATLLARGSAMPEVSVLAGTNRDEFRFFSFVALSRDDTLSSERLEALVAGYLRSAGVGDGLTPSAVVDFYRSARGRREESTDLRDLLDAFGTDWIFRVPLLRLLDAHGAHGAPTYCYRFDWTSPFGGGGLGSCHALELPFVFGSLEEPLVSLFTGTEPAALRLAETMQRAWVSFASGGVPSAPGLEPWPRYEPERRATMVLSADPHLEELPGEAERAFWEGHLGRYGVDGPIEGAQPTGVAFLDTGEEPSKLPGT